VLLHPARVGRDGEGGEDFCVAQRGQARRFATFGGSLEKATLGQAADCIGFWVEMEVNVFIASRQL